MVSLKSLFMVTSQLVAPARPVDGSLANIYCVEQLAANFHEEELMT